MVTLSTLWGESSGHRWIPAPRPVTQSFGIYLMSVGISYWTFDLPVTWNMTLLWRYRNENYVQPPFFCITLRWHHNDHDGVSNHQPHGCLLNRLFWRRSEKTSNLPAQRASYAENVFIWWRHHESCQREHFLDVSFRNCMHPLPTLCLKYIYGGLQYFE